MFDTGNDPLVNQRVAVLYPQKGSDSPVVITIAESPNGDLKGLPHWVQCILHHLGLVADGKPAERETRRGGERVRDGKKERGEKRFVGR